MKPTRVRIETIGAYLEPFRFQGRLRPQRYRMGSPLPVAAGELNGDAGSDTVDYPGRGQTVTVTIGAGADDGEADEGDAVAGSTEKVSGARMPTR
jgi:hypothetical protein